MPEGTYMRFFNTYFRRGMTLSTLKRVYFEKHGKMPLGALTRIYNAKHKECKRFLGRSDRTRQLEKKRTARRARRASAGTVRRGRRKKLTLAKINKLRAASVL